MRILLIMVVLLLWPSLLPAQDAAQYWRDRQYADRVRAEERRHELEIARLRSQTAIEVARQNRRYQHYHRPRIIGQPVSVLSPQVSKSTIIIHRGFSTPATSVISGGVGYSESSVTYGTRGFSYTQKKSRRVTRIGIGR